MIDLINPAEPDIFDSPEYTEAHAIADVVEDLLRQVRDVRAAKLLETDYIYLPDVTVSDEFKILMETYRQELRDFPSNYASHLSTLNIEELCSITPQSIVWPEKPE